MRHLKLSVTVKLSLIIELNEAQVFQTSTLSSSFYITPSTLDHISTFRSASQNKQNNEMRKLHILCYSKVKFDNNIECLARVFHDFDTCLEYIFWRYRL